ncbi:hypothetical protein BX070DRAFT_246933 [Coemansia spiralis]|nr:hypothetical protein BX070DRAFT_246933 [Coemansia spiralis]
MYINSLPSELIGTILRRAAYKEEPELYSWRRNLRLLHICKLWRVLALPTVYRILIFENTDEIAEEYVPSSCNNVITNPNYSTLSYIAGNGLCKFVRNIHIRVILNQLTLEQVIALLAYMVTNNSIDKKRINTLHIIFNSDELDSEDEQIALRLTRLALSICRNLPDIHRLSMQSIPGELGSVFFNCLARGYVGHLRDMSIIFEIQHPLPCFPKTLTSLFVNADYQLTTNIPRVFADTLQQLVLVGVPHDFAWGCFLDNTSSKSVVFAQLWELSLSYEFSLFTKSHIETIVSTADTRKISIHLPKLRYIDISNATECCYILRNGILPEKLKKMRISCDSRAFARLNTNKLEFVSQIDLDLGFEHNLEHGDPKVISAVSSIFSKPMKISYGKLAIPAEAFRNCADTIKWTNLHCLSLHSITDSNLINVLFENNSLPNLGKLSISFSNFENIALRVPGYSLAELHGQSLGQSSACLKPYTSMLTCFSITTNPSVLADQRQMCLLWMQYVVLRLHNLAYLFFESLLTSELIPQLRGIKQLYPHLSNIRYNDSGLLEYI